MSPKAPDFLRRLLEDLARRLTALEQALARLEGTLHDPAECWRLQTVVYRSLAGHCARKAREVAGEGCARKALEVAGEGDDFDPDSPA